MNNFKSRDTTFQVIAIDKTFFHNSAGESSEKNTYSKIKMDF